MSEMSPLKQVKRVSDIRYAIEEACRQEAAAELEMEHDGVVTVLRGKLNKSRYSKDDSFIQLHGLSAPPADLAMPPEAVIRVAFSIPRGFYRFSTSLREKKGDAIRLAYPKELEMTQRRTSHRIFFDQWEGFRVICADPDIEPDGRIEAFVVSLSASGFSCLPVSGGPKMMPGQPISRITLILPGRGEVTASGKVMDVVDAGRAGMAEQGQLSVVVFEKITTENHLRLIRFISSVDPAKLKKRG